MTNENPVFDVVARYFSMLSDATRLKILYTICAGEHPVSEIVDKTGCTQSNVSRNLSLMHQVGIVSRRKTGNFVYYRVSDPMLTDLCRTVCVQIAAKMDEQNPLRAALQTFHLDEGAGVARPLVPKSDLSGGPATG
jgi:DNA-binding transcriptional ArsR family regulator